MSRKSQVDKFNARLSKKLAEDEFINTRAYQEAQEDVKKYGAEGVKDLMSNGNIKEAAVVFSYEGMNAFANMFGNSMENAVVRVLDTQMDRITNSIEKKIESIVESKMLEMMQGMTAGIQKFTQEQSDMKQFAKAVNFADMYGGGAQPLKAEIPVEEAEKLIAQAKSVFTGVYRGTLDNEPQGSLEKAIQQYDKEVAEAKPLTPVQEQWNKVFEDEDPKDEEPSNLIDWDKLGTENKENESKPVFIDRGKHSYTRLIEPGYKGLKAQSTLTSVGISKEGINLLKPYFIAILEAYKGQQIRSTDVVRTLVNDFNIKPENPTAVWSRLMKENPNIDKAGFGLYIYEEKSFKPTI